MGLANAIANIMDRREKASAYLTHELLPSLDAAGRSKLAEEIRGKTAKRGYPGLEDLSEGNAEELLSLLRAELQRSSEDYRAISELVGHIPAQAFKELKTSERTS